MQDAMTVWDSICHSQWFEKSSIVSNVSISCLSPDNYLTDSFPEQKWSFREKSPSVSHQGLFPGNPLYLLMWQKKDLSVYVRTLMATKVMPRQGGTISGEDSFDSLGKQTRQETEKSMSSMDELSWWLALLLTSFHNSKVSQLPQIQQCLELWWLQWKVWFWTCSTWKFNAKSSLLFHSFRVSTSLYWTYPFYILLIYYCLLAWFCVVDLQMLVYYNNTSTSFVCLCILGGSDTCLTSF
jgi:hypothetical protein